MPLNRHAKTGTLFFPARCDESRKGNSHARNKFRKRRLPRRARIWSLRWQEGDSERESAARSLELALGIRPLTARLLCNRGYDDPAAAAAFLSHGGMQPHDPFLLTDMQPAVSRVLAAVRDGETVAVYGDYDVDGVTSVTCLYLYLRGLGVPVVRYIPNRLRERGYGMSRTGVDALAAKGRDAGRDGGHRRDCRPGGRVCRRTRYGYRRDGSP